MRNVTFEDEGLDSDFEDEGDDSSSSSSSYEDLVHLEKMVHELDLLYFETNLIRNNIAHFEYFYEKKREKKFTTVQSCPAIVQIWGNRNDWVSLDIPRASTPKSGVN